jgi:hypothetical protein
VPLRVTPVDPCVKDFDLDLRDHLMKPIQINPHSALRCATKLFHNNSRSRVTSNLSPLPKIP